MEKEKYTALILGSNGLIGSELLAQLQEKEEYAKVYAISRKPMKLAHSKIINILADQNNIEDRLVDVDFDHLYICIGTTKKKTPDLEEYFSIDHDYPVSVAKIAKKRSCYSVAVVSSIGANENSSQFYLQTKGKLEQSLIGMSFEKLHIFRPSLLLGDRDEKRFGEDIGKIFMKIFGIFCIGPFKKYKAIPASKVSKSMIINSLRNDKGVFFHTYKEIVRN